MTQNYFWERESETMYRQRQAAEFQKKVNKDAFEFLGQKTALSRGLPESVAPLGEFNLFNKKLVQPRDLEEVVPGEDIKKPKRDGGFLGINNSGLVRGAFGGRISQPWDVLRPVQRLLDAEQRYVTRPLASLVLSPLPGSYEDQPKLLRVATEALVDPLNYIGPGALTKGLKLLNMAPEARFALPALDSLFVGAGSKKAVLSVMKNAGYSLAWAGGSVGAEEIGVPGIIGGGLSTIALGRAPGFRGAKPVLGQAQLPRIAIPDFDAPLNTPVGLKTRFKPTNYDVMPEEFDAATSTNDFRAKANINFTRGTGENPTRISFVKSYDSRTPNLYEVIIHRDSATNWNGRNPEKADYKQLAELRDLMADLIQLNPEANFYAGPTDLRREEIYRLFGFGDASDKFDFNTLEAAGVYPVSRLNHNAEDLKMFFPEATNEEIQRMIRMGKTFPSHIILDKDYFMSKIARRNPTIGNTDLMKSAVDPSSDEMQKILQAEDDALEEYFKKIEFGKSPEDQEAAGEVLSSQLRQSNRLPPNLRAGAGKRLAPGAEGPGTPPKVSPRETSTDMWDMLQRVWSAPQDMFDTRTVESVFDTANQRKTVTGLLRQSMYKNLPKPIVDYMQSHGLRFQDTSVTAFVNEYNRLYSLRLPYAATVGDEIRGVQELMNDNQYLRTVEKRTLGTMVDDPALISQAKALEVEHPDIFTGNRLVTPDGDLTLRDLQTYKNLFDLTPQQRSALDALDAPYGPHMEFERLFGLSPTEVEYGSYSHKAPMRIKVGGGQVTQGGDAAVDSAMMLASRGERIKTGVKGLSSSKITQAEGIANGNTYLPYIEAQQQRISQGYKAMADKWLGMALEGEGKTATSFYPEEMVEGIKSLSQLKRQGSNMQKELKRLLGSAKGTAWIPPQGDIHSQLTDVVNYVNGASNLSKKARDIRVKDAQAQLEGILQAADEQFEPLREMRKSIREGLKDPESALRTAYPVEWHGQYFPLSQGRELQALERGKTADGISGFVQEVNNAIRPVMATLDVSFLGVQGLIAAFSNPVAYVKAAKTVFTSGYGDYESQLHRSGDLYKMIKDGVHWASRNDISEFLFPSWIARTPIVGGLADKSNSWFSQFGNVLRSEMYRTSVQSGMDDVTRQALARNVNLISGFSPNDPSSIEKSIMFAPRFFRSQMGLIADAVTKHDLSHDGAARALGTFLTMGVLTTYIANEALGNETSFDPDDPNFLRVRVGGRDLSVFGTWDTLARAVSKTFYNEGSLGLDADGAAYLARVKASPFVSRMWDIIDGETIGGQELNWGSPGDIILSAGKYASGFMPLSAQQLLQDPPDLTNPSSIAGSAAQFIGTKASPLSPSEKMAIKREQVAQTKYNKAWDDLEPYQQEELRKTNNLTLPSKSVLAKAFESRRAISERFTQAQQDIDESVPRGPEWIEAYQKLKNEQTGAYAQWAEEHPDALAKIRHGVPKNPNEKAQQDFYALFDTADQEGWTAGELSDAIDAFERRTPKAQLDYIERNSGLKNTEQVKEYKAAQRQLSEYWDLGDAIFERLKARLPQGSRYTSLQDWTNARVLEMQNAGVPDKLIVQRVQQNPVVKQINRATRELREKYRRKHKGTDRLLVTWYGAVPIDEQ